MAKQITSILDIFDKSTLREYYDTGYSKRIEERQAVSDALKGIMVNSGLYDDTEIKRVVDASSGGGKADPLTLDGVVNISTIDRGSEHHYAPKKRFYSIPTIKVRGKSVKTNILSINMPINPDHYYVLVAVVNSRGQIAHVVAESKALVRAATVNAQIKRIGLIYLEDNFHALHHISEKDLRLERAQPNTPKLLLDVSRNRMFPLGGFDLNTSMFLWRKIPN